MNESFRLGVGGLAIAVGMAMAAVAHAGEEIWTEINPAFAGAEYVRDLSVCAACHEEATKAYHKTMHSNLFEYGSQGDPKAGDCESCHGPRSKHIDEPDSSLAFSVAQYSKVCLQCHQDGSRMHWKSGLHQAADVGCVSCHSVMEKRSATGLLSGPNETAVCASCHATAMAEMRKTAHHPVREGKMACFSCHNPHGAPGRGMLVKGGVNETCYSCHQEKRGPFIWEHAPVRENCLTCHTPHGSNNRHLLTTQSASLCVTCHQYGGHVNQYRYNRVSTPYGNGCVNCHTAVHGSNHPSGAKFTR